MVQPAGPSCPQVRADKQREVKAGHDGSWVAHPALVSVAMEQYNEFMPQCNQLFRWGDTGWGVQHVYASWLD